MRKTLLLPLKFLIFFIISAAVFSLFILIFSWGQNFSRITGGENSLWLFFSAAAANIIFPSVSSALLFTAFDYRGKTLGVFQVLLLAASVFAVLFFGLRLAASLEEPESHQIYQAFQPDNLHKVDDALIYTGTADIDGSIEDIIIRKDDSGNPSFEYYRSGEFKTDPAPVLNAGGSLSIEVEPRNPVYSHIFRPPGLLERYTDDIGFFNSVYLSAAVGSMEDFLLMVTALTAFLVICLIFKGVTVWPLFEMTLILFLHRIALYIINLFSREADFISETFFGGSPVQNIPLLTIAGLSLLLLLCGLLLRTSQRMRKK